MMGLNRFAVSLQKAGMICLIALATCSIGIGINNALLAPSGSLDFLYINARALRLGYDPYTIDTLSPSQKQQISPSTTTNSWVAVPTLPSCLALLVPYTVLNWNVARTAWLMSNFVFSALLLSTIFKLAPNVNRSTQWVIALLFLASTPWRVTIGNGQYGLFAASFLLLGLRLSDDKPTLATLAISIGLYKYHLVGLLLAPLVVNKRVTLIISAIIIHGLLTVGVGHWLSENPTSLIRQSFRCARGLERAGWIDIPSLVSGVPITGLYMALAGVVMLIVGVIWKYRNVLNTIDVLSVLSILSVLVVYHRIYDFVLLVIPLTWAIANRASEQRWTWCTAVTAGWVFSIWFGEKIIQFGIPSGVMTFRYLVSIWGWITLGMIATKLVKNGVAAQARSL